MKTTSDLSGREMAEIRREAIEFAGIGLYRYNFDGIVQFMDAGAMRILDLQGQYPDPESVRQKDIADLFEYTGPRKYLRKQIRKYGRARDLEYPFRTLTGIDRWALHDSYLVTDADTGEDFIQVIIRDITERKRAEIALAAEKERLAVTLCSIGDGVITTDVHGCVEIINECAALLTGFTQEDALGKPLSKVFRIVNEQTREPCENPVTRVFETNGVIGLANGTVLIARDGTERIIADSEAPIRDQSEKIIGVVLVFRDVTRQTKVEEEMARVERLSSLGVLAGGIAHDFNNLLTGILGAFSLIEIKSQDPDLLRHARLGEQATMRAKDLTSQLLTFAKGGVPLPKTTAIEHLLTENIGFTLRGSRVTHQVSVTPELWLAHVDETQVCQVINNLVLNAEQSMPDGGTIRVVCSNELVTNDSNVPLDEGRYVKLSIIDQGIGIPAQLLDKVFDPFFTTKQKGSGLGLSTAFSIVKKHNGHLAVRSQLGKGTVFDVYLPAADKADTPPTQPATASTVLPSARILVMDDEPTVRDTLEQMLSVLGQETEFTTNGAQTVAKYREAFAAKEPFDLVILDLTIPGGAGGRQVLNQLVTIDPDVRAVASSGYSTDAVMAGFERFGFVAALPKPYKMSALRSLLASVLRKKPRA